MANNVYLKGQLACVSANHIVAVRIVTDGNGFIVQALTVDWAINLNRHDNIDDAVKDKEFFSKSLNHQ